MEPDAGMLQNRLLAIGIPLDQKDYHWIAEQSLATSLPDGWQELPDHSYFHFESQTRQLEHPSLDYYKHLYQVLTKESKLPNNSKSQEYAQSDLVLQYQQSVGSPSMRDIDFVRWADKIQFMLTSRSNSRLADTTQLSPISRLHKLIEELIGSDLISPSKLSHQSLTKLLLEGLRVARMSDEEAVKSLIALFSGVGSLLNILSTNSILKVLETVFGKSVEDLTHLGEIFVPVLCAKYSSNEGVARELQNARQLMNSYTQKIRELENRLADADKRYCSLEEIHTSSTGSNAEALQTMEARLEARDKETDHVINLVASCAPDADLIAEVNLLKVELETTRKRAVEAEKQFLAYLSNANERSSSCQNTLQGSLAAAKRINRKKAIIFELREKNNDLMQANLKLSQELQAAVRLSMQLNNQNEFLADRSFPPPYRVVGQALEHITHNLESQTEAVSDLSLALAMATADRDEINAKFQQSNEYITLLEGQLKEIRIKYKAQGDLLESTNDKARYFGGIQEKLVRNLQGLRNDCDRLCLKINRSERNPLVICKLKPTSQRSEDHKIIVDRNTVSVTSASFKFDRIIHPDEKHSALLEELEPSVRQVMHGGRFCAMCYGPSKSGKTYTMLGNRSNEEGLVYKALGLLFSIADIDLGKQSTNFAISIAEMHNETLFDLLSDRVDATGKEEICIRNNGEAVYVEGLSALRVSTLAEVSTILNRVPNENLQPASKLHNSHVIYSIEVVRRHLETGLETRGYIQLVELAASDLHRLSSVDTKSQWRFKEGQQINRSLTSLHEVLTAAFKPSECGMIPRYRCSQLTNLLQMFLRPESKLALVIHLDPTQDMQEDNCASLKYLSFLSEF